MRLAGRGYGQPVVALSALEFWLGNAKRREGQGRCTYLLLVVKAFVVVLKDGCTFCLARVVLGVCVGCVACEDFLPEGEAAGWAWLFVLVENCGFLCRGSSCGIGGQLRARSEALESWSASEPVGGGRQMARSESWHGRIGDAINLLMSGYCSWRPRLFSRAIDRAVPRVGLLASQAQDPESSSSLWLASAQAGMRDPSSSHILHMHPYSGTFGISIRIV